MKKELRNEEESEEESLMEEEQDEYISSEEEVKQSKPIQRKDPVKLFNLKDSSEVKFAKTVPKLSSDDAAYMKPLIAKYGDDFKVLS